MELVSTFEVVWLVREVVSGHGRMLTPAQCLSHLGVDRLFASHGLGFSIGSLFVFSPFWTGFFVFLFAALGLPPSDWLDSGLRGLVWIFSPSECCGSPW